MKMAQDKEELIGKLKEEIDLLNRVSKYFIPWLCKEGISVCILCCILQVTAIGQDQKRVNVGVFCICVALQEVYQ